jgi:hypothetical protein
VTARVVDVLKNWRGDCVSDQRVKHYRPPASHPYVRPARDRVMAGATGFGAVGPPSRSARDMRPACDRTATSAVVETRGRRDVSNLGKQPREARRGVQRCSQVAEANVACRRVRVANRRHRRADGLGGRRRRPAGSADAHSPRARSLCVRDRARFRPQAVRASPLKATESRHRERCKTDDRHYGQKNSHTAPSDGKQADFRVYHPRVVAPIAAGTPLG